VPAARMAAGAGLARFWLYHALEQGRPGVLKVSAAELAALKRLWQLKAAFDLPPLMRAVLQEGAFQEHEGGKQSLTVKCGQGGSQTAEFDVLDAIADSILRDVEEILMAQHDLPQQPAAAAGAGAGAGAAGRAKRKRESSSSESELNAWDSPGDCLSELTLFRYPRGSSAARHEDRGLLTLVFCPGNASLLDHRGSPVAAKEDELIVLAGHALSLASAGRFPATLHSVGQTQTERLSLVFRCRGNKRAELDTARFASAGSQEAQQPPQSLEQIYKRFEATHSSVNSPRQAAAPAALLQPARGAGAAPEAPAGHQPATIILRFRSQSGDEVYIKAKPDTKFGKFFQEYCVQKGIGLHAISSNFDGRNILSQDTPKMLELKDGDVIHVMLVQEGD